MRAMTNALGAVSFLSKLTESKLDKTSRMEKTPKMEKTGGTSL